MMNEKYFVKVNSEGKILGDSRTIDVIDFETETVHTARFNDEILSFEETTGMRPAPSYKFDDAVMRNLSNELAKSKPNIVMTADEIREYMFLQAEVRASLQVEYSKEFASTEINAVLSHLS